MALIGAPYLVFLIGVFFCYWLIAGGPRLRVLFLVAVSYFFYAQAGVAPLVLLFLVSTTDFAIARSIGASADARKRKRLLAASLVIDLGALCSFKCADFFVGNAPDSLLPGGTSLTAVVPIGVSFFIFQTVAYVVDVYRRDSPPASSYVDYLSYVSFFPTIMAGPILRARQLLPQLRSALFLDADSGGRALSLIALGMIKKIAIADYLAANLVDRVFDFPERFSSLEVLLAVYGYAVQIYADFSGYSDIAIGSALLLGFKLPANFNQPYRSRSLIEFWRRWHISLSTWLRDYVFYTVVGGRVRNETALYFGLVVTMLIGGLWHGAGWTFVVWGLLHGVGLVVARAYGRFRDRTKPQPIFIASSILGRGASVLSILLTFHFVCLAWVFFRAGSISEALSLMQRLLVFSLDTTNVALPVVAVVATALAAHFLPESAAEYLRVRFVRLPAPVQAAVLFGVGLGLYTVAGTDVLPFIYARF